MRAGIAIDDTKERLAPAVNWRQTSRLKLVPSAYRSPGLQVPLP